MNWDLAFSERTGRMRSSEIRDFLKLVGQPGVISFAGGLPDPALFPAEKLQRAADRILGDPMLRAKALQYSPSEGYAPLREWIAAYMTSLGAPVAMENIVLVGGSQAALDLIGKLFVDPGDTVLTTNPAYLGALQSFEVYQPQWASVDLETGQITGGGPPAIAYAVPDFANPSGETVPREKRERLLDVVTELGIPLVEDSAYQALRYDGEPVSPLLALDIARCGDINRSRVIYTGTFSKTVTPGLRVGWVCAAEPVIRKLVLARQAADLHSSSLDQMLIHAVVSDGYDEQVASLLPVYRHRRDAMHEALLRWMPNGVTWTKPEGGMFFWLTLPDGMSSRDLVRESIATEGIIFVPGTSFYPEGGGEQHMRLNYTLSDDASIEDGIRRLGGLIGRRLDRLEKPAGETPSAVGGG
jgi:DNA-binding transcriptional MocR family regulator